MPSSTVNDMSPAAINPLVQVRHIAAYDIKLGGEYATFCVDYGSRANCNWVRLIVDSSFGAVAHTWSDIGAADRRDFFAQLIESPDRLARKDRG